MANEKDTIYIDIDEEITGIIDKVTSSKSSLVALVLPKRATVFQSTVNMRLLKRASENAKKNLVLITSEAGLLPLAGAAGLYVARTLNSKPEIPLAPRALTDLSDEENEILDDIQDGAVAGSTPLDYSKPISQLSKSGLKPDSDIETIELDNAGEPEDEQAAEDAASTKAFNPKTNKNKKLKVPNFNKFRLRIMLGILLLIVIAILAIFFLKTTKATISISTDATNVPVSLSLSLSPDADVVNPSNGLIPSKEVTQTKTFSASVVTTGQKNEGNKASGTITVTANCSNGLPADIPAGTGVSSNNLTYITEDDITFAQGNLTHNGCTATGQDGTNSSNGSNIPIIAQAGGSSYNVSGVPFTIALSGYSGLNATGSASGGTDNIVQTVNQNDINNAKSKISTSSSSQQGNLSSELESDGYYAISATYNATSPTVTASAAVGTQANNVTVTENIVYSMFGVKRTDLDTLITDSISNQINTSSQVLQSDGVNNSGFSVNSVTGDKASLTLNTNAIVGPNISVATIKQEAEGSSVGSLKTKLGNNPNITNVSVNLSPFWASKIPSNPSDITVKITKPTKTVSAKSSNN